MMHFLGEPNVLGQAVLIPRYLCQMAHLGRIPRGLLSAHAFFVVDMAIEVTEARWTALAGVAPPWYCPSGTVHGRCTSSCEAMTQFAKMRLLLEALSEQPGLGDWNQWGGAEAGGDG